MAYNFEHVHLKAPDPEKTANWYVKAFNFEIFNDRGVRPTGDRFIECKSEDGTIFRISGARTDERMGQGDADVHYGLEHFGHHRRRHGRRNRAPYRNGRGGCGRSHFQPRRADNRVYQGAGRRPHRTAATPLDSANISSFLRKQESSAVHWHTWHRSNKTLPLWIPVFTGMTGRGI